MIILDTQPVSQLQHAGSADVARLETKLRAVAPDDVWITVITPYEQLKECSSDIDKRATQPARQVPFFDLPIRLLTHYEARWRTRILPFDARSAAILTHFEPR